MAHNLQLEQQTKQLKWNIEKTVGPQQANRPEDVRQVRSMLNMIGIAHGGTYESPLADLPTFDDELGRAITYFQRRSTVLMNLPPSERGCVIPGGKTLLRLNELAGSFVTGPDVVSQVRRQIVAVARKEMNRIAVSDRIPPEGGWKKENGHLIRRGWRDLQGYFDAALDPPLDWNSSHKFKYTYQRFNQDPTDDVDYNLTFLEGIKYRNMRPPTGGAVAYPRQANTPAGQSPPVFWNGQHWCGFFAVWVLHQVGMKHVKWRNRQISATVTQDYDSRSHQPGQVLLTEVDYRQRRKLISGELSPRPGDVVVIPKNNHHLIFTSRDGDRFKAIAGNSLYQEIREESHPIQQIYRLYHVWP